MKLTAYTDGACSANGTSKAKAGWAFVLLDEDENLIAEGAGGVDNGTNNIGELTAIIKAIEAAAELSPEKLEILSDSAYCINGITNWRYNWKKNDWWRDAKKTQELKNRELWITLDHLIDMSYMEFEKVAGHSGVEWNEIVDKLAVARTR
jgi:ribonuclease HI